MIGNLATGSIVRGGGGSKGLRVFHRLCGQLSVTLWILFAIEMFYTLFIKGWVFRTALACTPTTNARSLSLSLSLSLCRRE
jgi:hypothetical protein